jgi:predicted amidohydrolase
VLLRVATTQFRLDRIRSEKEFWERVERLVAESRNLGAELVLFPEYFVLALSTCRDPSEPFVDRLHGIAREAGSIAERSAEIARAHRITIVAGSQPDYSASGRLINRTRIVDRDGRVITQDKIHLTRFESEEWGVAPGDAELRLFDVGGVRCAVNICYDVEFPHLAQAAASSGAQVLFVPSCTDDVHGYWRVRHTAEARAVENQLFVVLASDVGGDPREPAIEAHYGQGAILTPCDRGFPPRGVLAEGTLGEEGIAVGTLDLALLDEIRRDGTVLNLRDSLGLRAEFAVPHVRVIEP